MPTTPPITENYIFMATPWQTVFRLASEVEHWPDILPHYRWVKTLENGKDSRRIEMAARRGFWPVKWQAVLTPCESERRVYFRHVGGPARGMKVYWELQERDGGTDVSIHHEMSLEVPFIRTPLGRWIVVHGFIGPIATRTLSCMKRIAEGARA